MLEVSRLGIMYTYQLWWGDFRLGQFSEPEYAERVRAYAHPTMELQMELLPAVPNIIVFDYMLPAIECHALIYFRLGVRI